MDKIVNYYGQDLIYLLISPYSDYQPEFINHVQISTIQHYQVFFYFFLLLKTY